MLKTIIQLIIAFVYFSNPALCAEPRKHMLKGPIHVEVVRVVDGDTFLARAEIWLGQEITVLVRIRGIDAPELKAKCAKERGLAQTATDQLTALLSQAPLELRNITGEKYFGRVLADVTTSQAGDAATQLLHQALVRPYRGKKRKAWC